MNSISIEENQTHPSSIGTMLRKARELSGISVHQAAVQLRVPHHLIEALEIGDWSRLGAPVYIRGMLRSYAKFLKMDPEFLLETAKVEPAVAVELIARGDPLPRFSAEKLKQISLVLGVICLIVLASVFFIKTFYFSEDDVRTASLDRVPTNELVLPTTNGTLLEPTSPPPSSAPMQPVVATTNTSPSGWLTLRFLGDSWVQVIGSDGKTLENKLFQAGEQRSFNQDEVANIKLGNATAVEVLKQGNTVDLSAYLRANVARFAVSSDGSLTATASRSAVNSPNNNPQTPSTTE